jgi:hypothetical protein
MKMPSYIRPIAGAIAFTVFSAMVPIDVWAANTRGAAAARQAFSTPIQNLTGFFSEFAKLAFIIVILLLLIAMYFNKGSDEPKQGMVRACVIVAAVVALPTIVSLVVSGGSTV